MLTSPGVTTAPPRSSAPSGASPAPSSATSPSSIRIQPRSCSVPASSIVTTHALPRITAASSGTSSKRSTSTSPRSVSFRDGITDSARNARCWNGASSSQPSSRAAAIDRVRGLDHLCERRVREQAGDRQRQLREHLGAVDDDDAAAAVREPAHGGGHRRVVHPDDDDVVRVVRDRRCERAALQAEPAHEAEPDAARAEVPLDDRDLREVALGIGERLAGSVGGLVHERVGHDLARHDPDHARVAALPRDAEHLRAERADPHRVAHPVRHLRLAGSPRPGCPRLSTVSGTKRSRSGRTSRSAW